MSPLDSGFREVPPREQAKPTTPTQVSVMWAVFDYHGNLMAWTVRVRRADAQIESVSGCMGFREFERLGNDHARWRYLYRQGYRAAKVTVTRAREPQA